MEKKIERRLWFTFIVIIISFFIGVSVFGQALNPTYQSVKVDSIRQLSDTLWITDTQGSNVYLRSSGDTIYFGDVSGERYLGDIPFSIGGSVDTLNTRLTRFNTSVAVPAYVEGQLYWNATEGTLALQTATGTKYLGDSVNYAVYSIHADSADYSDSAGYALNVALEFGDGLTKSIGNIVSIGDLSMDSGWKWSMLSGDFTVEANSTSRIWETFIYGATGDETYISQLSNEIQLSQYEVADNTTITVDLYSGGVTIKTDSSTVETSISLLNDVMTVASNDAVFAGVQYNADYSTYYTNRSLIDKEYVDNNITSAKDSVADTYTANDSIGIAGSYMRAIPQNGLWFWNAITSMYTPYSTLTVGSFYSGTTNPTGTTRLNWDGNFYANQFRTYTTGTGGYFESTASYGLQAISGTGTCALFSQASNVSNSSALITLSRTNGGTGNIIGDIISITDYPTTSGTISGKILSVATDGVERISFNPRATRTGTAYFLDTDSTLSTGKLLDIKNQGSSIVSVTPDTSFFNNIIKTNEINLNGTKADTIYDSQYVIENTPLDSIAVNSFVIKDFTAGDTIATKEYVDKYIGAFSRWDSMNTNAADVWLTVKLDTVCQQRTSSIFQFNADSTGIIIGYTGFLKFSGHAKFKFNGSPAADASIYIRLMLNSVEQSCFNTAATRNFKVNGATDLASVAGFIYVEENDTISVQVQVTDTDIDLESINGGVFDNEVAFTIFLESLTAKLD